MSFNPDLFAKQVDDFRTQNETDPRTNKHAGAGRFFSVSAAESYEKAVSAIFANNKS